MLPAAVPIRPVISFPELFSHKSLIVAILQLKPANPHPELPGPAVSHPVTGNSDCIQYSVRQTPFIQLERPKSMIIRKTYSQLVARLFTIPSPGGSVRMPGPPGAPPRTAPKHRPAQPDRGSVTRSASLCPPALELP